MADGPCPICGLSSDHTDDYPCPGPCEDPAGHDWVTEDYPDGGDCLFCYTCFVYAPWDDPANLARLRAKKTP